MNDPKEHMKIEFVSESTDSGDNQHYADESNFVGFPVKEQTTLSVIGLILAVPFPILIVVLWVTVDLIKQQSHLLGQGTMNAVLLYLFMFFIIPVLSIISVIIAFIVTIKSKQIAKKIGYISMAITALGLVILGLFLNHS